MKNLMIFLIVIFLFAGCTKDSSELSDNLRLRYKGADMPIWVRGNALTDHLVIFLHGGPGGCAMCLRTYFMEAEKQALIAYWDQRMAGSSGGTASADMLTYTQFADDLKQVVLLLKKQYPDKRIYLLGHSFGVELAWQFLTTGDNQSLVNGFIAMDGTYSTYEWLLTVREWIMDEATRQNDDEAYDYASNLLLTEGNLSDQIDWGELYKRIFRLDGNPVWPSDDRGYNIRLWFFSPHSEFSNRLNSSLYDGYYDKEIYTFNKKEQLASVSIPVTIFWGGKDGIMPLNHAYQTSELLPGKPAPIVFTNSWHSPFHTENELFTQELIRAIQ